MKMNRMWTWRLASALALVVASSAVMGCAQKVGDIDRTQPEIIDKKQFLNDDEWYMQTTVVDTDMQGSAVFAAAQGDLKRVRWTVTEKVLYAHSSVELAIGLYDGFDEEESRRTGVVGAFAIRSHFDVQRNYNSATGEPSNVISENSSDRPWYERDYMRVDWSRNLVEAFDIVGFYLGNTNPIQRVTYPEEGRQVHPHRTRISEGIIDTVTEFAYDPDVNACYGAFGLDSAYNGCEGGRISVRNFFMKVPTEKTYIPLNYTDSLDLTRDGTPAGEPVWVAQIFDPDLGYQVEVECTPEVKTWMLNRFGYDPVTQCSVASFELGGRFGYFRTERVGWDRHAGSTDYNRRYYANRWNIWQTMLDDDGEALPVEDRTPKPITYHLNPEYPEFMFEAAQVTAEEWNDAFRETVMLAQGITDEQLDEVLMEEYGHTKMYRIVENSCHPGPLVQWRNEFGGDRSEDKLSVHGIFQEYVGSLADDAEMERALWDLTNKTRVQLCAELEFATEDRPIAEERFDWERVGDLRYSFFNWVESDVPWAGYGPSAADPNTGEIISGNANYAGSYVRRISTYAADLIQYFNGELSESDIIAGTQIRHDLFQNEDSASNRFGLSPEAKREMALRAGLNPEDVSPTNFNEPPAPEDLHPFIQHHGPKEMQRQADLHSIAASKQSARDERMITLLENPDIKNFMMGSPEVQMAIEATARERFGPQFTPEQEHQVYLDFHTPRVSYDRMRERSQLLSERNIMTHDNLSQMVETLVTYRGAADFFKGMDRTDIIEHFMNSIFVGTQLHEIGHTVGLRHNFAASTDALNFHDEYWEIELAVVEGRITRDQAYSLQGELAVEIGGEGWDYLNQAELKLASVMDYTGDLTGRFSGLGKYDRAAIHFAYGELVEKWRGEYTLPNLIGQDTWLRDYKDLPIIFGAIRGGGTEAQLYANGVDIINNGREYVPLSEAIQERRDGIIENTEIWRRYGFGPSNPPHIDRSVAYEFCTDHDNGRVLNCATFDYGANQTEIVNHSFNTYRALQTFWRNRRHSVSRGFENYSSYINRLFNTFIATQEPFRYYSFYRWYDLGDYTDDLQRASIDAFNFYNEVLATPEPGRYCMFNPNTADIDQNWFFDLTNTYVPARFDIDGGECPGFIDIPNGIGQPYNFTFSDEYDYRIDRVGTYIDKTVASQMLFELNADFSQSAFLTDFRATSMSYWTTFRDEMLQMLSGVLLGDYVGYGGVLTEQGEYADPVPVHTETLGLSLPNPQAGLPRIYTPQSIGHELNMLIGGMIYSSGWEDREVDFAHYVKVSVGNSEGQPFGPGVPLKEFVHPVTYQVYQVADLNDETIAGRMVDRANYLSARFQVVDNDLQQAVPGTPEYVQLRALRDHRLEQLQDVVAKMDMSRFVFDALGANALN